MKSLNVLLLIFLIEICIQKEGFSQAYKYASFTLDYPGASDSPVPPTVSAAPATTAAHGVPTASPTRITTGNFISASPTRITTVNFISSKIDLENILRENKKIKNPLNGREHELNEEIDKIKRAVLSTDVEFQKQALTNWHNYKKRRAIVDNCIDKRIRNIQDDLNSDECVYKEHLTQVLQAIKETKNDYSVIGQIFIKYYKKYLASPTSPSDYKEMLLKNQHKIIAEIKKIANASGSSSPEAFSTDALLKKFMKFVKLIPENLESDETEESEKGF